MADLTDFMADIEKKRKRHAMCEKERVKSLTSPERRHRLARRAEQKRFRFAALSDEHKDKNRSEHSYQERLRLINMDSIKKYDILNKRVLAYHKSHKKLLQRKEEEETMLMFHNDKQWLTSNRYSYSNHVTWYWLRLRDKSKFEARAYINKIRSSKITHYRRNCVAYDFIKRVAFNTASYSTSLSAPVCDIAIISD